jgi:hypothetical protein
VVFLMMNRRRIQQVFGMAPAALSAAKPKASAVKLRRAPRMGWPDLDEILAPRPPRTGVNRRRRRRS